MERIETPRNPTKKRPLIALVAYVPMALLGLAFLLRVPYGFLTDPGYMYSFAQSKSPSKWTALPAELLVALLGASLLYIAVTGLLMRSVSFAKHLAIPALLYALFIVGGVVGLSSRPEASLYDRIAFAAAVVCLLCLVAGWRTYIKTARATPQSGA